LSLLTEPLDRRWLERARRSHSAEPMTEPVYRIAPLTAGHGKNSRCIRSSGIPESWAAVGMSSA